MRREKADIKDVNVPATTTTTLVSSNKFKLNPVDKHFSDILNKSMLLREKRQSVNSNQDKDKRFCLSSYKEFKKVLEHGLIWTIIQILEVIQRAQDFDNPLPIQPSYSTFPYSSAPTNQPSYSNQFGQGPSQLVQPNLHPLIVATNQPFYNQYGQAFISSFIRSLANWKCKFTTWKWTDIELFNNNNWTFCYLFID